MECLEHCCQCIHAKPCKQRTTEPYVDLANASRHRGIDKTPTNKFYDEQAKMLEATPIGVRLPKSVRVGELPQVNIKGLEE